MDLDYYVYTLSYYDRLLYVGSGRLNRIDHVLSCKSHNQYLNRFVAIGYLNEGISLIKIKENLTLDESLTIEKDLIFDQCPLFNSQNNGKSWNIIQERDNYLEQHQFNRMFDVLKWKKSESYLQRFKNEIEQLKHRLDDLIDENERLKTALKRLDV